MGKELQDRVVFVTGGANGIGRACAQAYAGEGARVVIADIDGEAAAAVAGALPREAMGLACDVSKAAEVESAINKTVERFGALHAVHNNAGLASPSKPLHLTSDEDWDRLFAVNLKSVLYTTRYAFEALKDARGCILNTASLVGEIGQADHAAYVGTKGGMIALTKAMALDYAADRIRVNALCPAGVWTEMLRGWASEQADPEGIATYLDRIHALGYCPEGDVVAHAAVFLLSDRAAFITGCALPVSGGAELGYRR